MLECVYQMLNQKIITERNSMLADGGEQNVIQVYHAERCLKTKRKTLFLIVRKKLKTQ